MQRELGAIVSIVVGLLFLEFLPRRIADLSHDTLRAIFRAIGIYFLVVAGTTLAVAWKFITPSDAESVARIGIGWVGAVVIVFGGADVYAWWASRRRYR
ncbi:hypothetical protein LCGC14_2826610 [marine sediment metagenome]|uniref:Uncharacterized protein n=1 Tax=marine sediment metagenome TaxID=412755 RepID=A0A0F9ANR7_9ZZZZ